MQVLKLVTILVAVNLFTSLGATVQQQAAIDTLNAHLWEKVRPEWEAKYQTWLTTKEGTQAIACLANIFNIIYTIKKSERGQKLESNGSIKQNHYPIYGLMASVTAGIPEGVMRAALEIDPSPIDAAIRMAHWASYGAFRKFVNDLSIDGKDCFEDAMLGAVASWIYYTEDLIINRLAKRWYPDFSARDYRTIVRTLGTLIAGVCNALVSQAYKPDTNFGTKFITLVGVPTLIQLSEEWAGMKLQAMAIAEQKSLVPDVRV